MPGGAVAVFCSFLVIACSAGLEGPHTELHGFAVQVARDQRPFPSVAAAQPEAGVGPMPTGGGTA